MIKPLVELASIVLEPKPAGKGSQFTPKEKRLQRFNNVKPLKISKSVKEYFNNKKKYQQPRKAQKSMGDST